MQGKPINQWSANYAPRHTSVPRENLKLKLDILGYNKFKLKTRGFQIIYPSTFNLDFKFIKITNNFQNLRLRYIVDEKLN